MKKKFIIIIMVIFIIIGGIIFQESWTIDCRIYISKNKFHQYQEDFQIMADKVLSIKDELLKEYDDNYILVDDEMIRLYDFQGVGKSHDTKQIKLTKEEKNSLRNVCKTYDDDDSDIYCISFNENQVLFESDWDKFAVVYSPETKPKDMGQDDDDSYDFIVEKLADNWYSVKGNPK